MVRCYQPDGCIQASFFLPLLPSLGLRLRGVAPKPAVPMHTRSRWAPPSFRLASPRVSTSTNWTTVGWAGRPADVPSHDRLDRHRGGLARAAEPASPSCHGATRAALAALSTAAPRLVASVASTRRPAGPLRFEIAIEGLLRCCLRRSGAFRSHRRPSRQPLEPEWNRLGYGSNAVQEISVSIR